MQIEKTEKRWIVTPDSQEEKVVLNVLFCSLEQVIAQDYYSSEPVLDPSFIQACHVAGQKTQKKVQNLEPAQ